MIPNRLSAPDLVNLALEAPDTLMHQAAFGVIEGACLLDAGGRLRLKSVHRRLAVKIAQTPELRRALHPTGFLQGRLLWVEDPAFRIENHVLGASLPPPGGERAALEFVERLMAEPMDRSRPLWQLWLLDGYAPDRVAIVVKMHHALADGLAMLNMLLHVLDVEPVESEPPPPPPYVPSPPPRPGALVLDNLGSKARVTARAAWRLRHPVRLVHSAVSTLQGAAETLRRGGRAPRTSINRPTSAPRRIAVLRLDLDRTIAVAHAAGAKVNDVFLAVVAGGLRAALAARGEAVDGVTLHGSMAVSLYAEGENAMAGNRNGTVVVPLPLAANADARLRAIAKGTALAKSRQRAAATPAFMVLLARSGLMRRYIRRQHLINVLTTDLPGPRFPLFVAGARILEVFAVPPIAGNVTVSFAAISYEGRLGLSVVADAGAWPDLDALVAGMDTSWSELSGDVATVPHAIGL